MTNLDFSHRSLSESTIETIFKTKFVFFTGKGGVGKTSIASASALTLAERGKRVLLVSTDPASNLDETFGVKLTNHPLPVPQVPGLMALNVNPELAAEEYRARVIAPMIGKASEGEIAGLREQLSGACTVEIAAFDEFTSLISDPKLSHAFDIILFDTAPTGHTLRLLSLPQAWTGFFEMNERGASCLGPHTALKSQEVRFAEALQALRNPELTTFVLVTRPEKSTMNEALRSSQELKDLGLSHQILIMNGVFMGTDSTDPLARGLANQSRTALISLPEGVRGLPLHIVPLRPFNTVGLSALRALLADVQEFKDLPSKAPIREAVIEPDFSLAELARELATQERGLVLVMGKGGVGKTTVASALALAIARHGKEVHLSTTDPAAHLAQTIEGSVPHLTISRIDPKEETRIYTEKILESKGKSLDSEALELLREDLASPCTEEVAVFHAFARTVFEARRSIVILDTAPTGHSLLLLDAAGSYHREMLKKFEESAPGKVTTPLMMLQDPKLSKVLLVTLAETTPVSEAASLQDDLRRASIEPYGWVVNRSLGASDSTDPVLRQRAILENEELKRMADGLARRLAILPLMAEEPVGVKLLLKLVGVE